MPSPKTTDFRLSQPENRPAVTCFTLPGSSMCAKAVQSRKAPLEISATPFGMISAVSDVQLSNALPPILFSFAGSCTSDNAEQAKNARSPSCVTLFGTEICVSAWQARKASSPIAVRLPGRATSERREQPEKAALPSVVTPSATERDRICILYAAHGAAAGKSAILPVPEIVSVPSVSNVQVRLSPQVPSTAAAESGGTHRHSSREMQSTAASTRFIILSPFARRDAPRQNSALIIT